MKSLNFTLNGKPLDLKPVPPLAKRIIEALQRQKDGELFNSKEAAALSGSTESSLRSLSGCDVLIPYRAKVRFPKLSLVWGNRRTIAELQKHKELLA